MDTLSAFAMGMANRGKQPRVFDWDKAARLIVEHGATDAVAGLDEDMEWTAGSILVSGKIPAERESYLASTWATPVLEFDGHSFECFRMQEEVPDWGPDTFWPESAKAILTGDAE